MGLTIEGSQHDIYSFFEAWNGTSRELITPNYLKIADSPTFKDNETIIFVARDERGKIKRITNNFLVEINSDGCKLTTLDEEDNEISVDVKRERGGGKFSDLVSSEFLAALTVGLSEVNEGNWSEVDDLLYWAKNLSLYFED